MTLKSLMTLMTLRKNLRSKKIQVLDKPDKKFEVNWRAIETLELYEEMLLKEAERLRDAKQFDQAFPYYRRLLAKYDYTPGLEASRQKFVFDDAVQLFQKGRNHEALGLLEELYRLNSAFPALQQGISTVVDRLAMKYVTDGDYQSAQRLLQRLEKLRPNWL